MRFAVLRSFNSPSRRFSVGQIVTAAEIDGPVSPEDLASSGLIKIEDQDAPVAPLTMRRRSAAPLPPPVVVENENGVE